jgi:glycosyltransferase involved in cell wall biosynthesis
MVNPRVTALIIARDEADHLPDCLATLGWAQEVVVVVDAASRDATEAIARRQTDLVIRRRFDDFAGQRNAGLDRATGDWVFAIDADERVTPELAAEIRRVTADTETSHDGYRVPIKSEVLGRAFAYSGTQDDNPLRLVRRAAGRWSGEVHETFDLRGTVGQLAHPIRHRTLSDLRTFLRKLNTYTTLEARRLQREGRPVRSGDLAIRPLLTFLKLYLFKQGFRDGPEGLLFCALSAVSVMVRNGKHRELIRMAASNRPRGTRKRRRRP